MQETSSGIPGLCRDIETLGYLRPYVRQCGDERRPAWRIETRCLLDYLLVYIAEGRGQFEIAGRRYAAEPNDLFWIPPNTPHTMEGFPPSMLCPYIHFDLIYREVSHWDFSVPDGMTDFSELEPLMHPDMSHTPFGDLRGRIRSYTNRRVGDLVREVCRESARAQPYAFMRTSGLMMEIFAEIMRGRHGIPAEYHTHIPLLEEAAGYLREHCHEDISIAVAAELCRLSPSYFRRLFSQHFGYSPRLYLRRTRIQKAKRLMIGSIFNLTEIARMCGFATVHSFSRAFRAVEGLSPSEYRQCGGAKSPQP
ncbi:MAG: AraC family transcriptional regulator [Phycisphaerae bacterium]|nr:AraC family transcriptional regulator [Phycisphaerae bacterium]